MGKATSILFLIIAASLEAGGDALVRMGLHTESRWSRIFFFAIAMLVLFAYGWTVNSPPWDFGKLLGLYVVFFFVIAQLVSWLVFEQAPSATILLGGCFIVVGGLIISLSRA